jgi:hypothetical protein
MGYDDKSTLADYERTATPARGNVDDVATAEDTPSSFTYKGTGRSTALPGKGKLSVKKFGPLTLIVGLILGAGSLTLVGQSLAPFGILNNLTDQFNSMKTIMNRRSDRFLRWQLDTTRVKTPTKATIFGKDKFSLSNKQVKKLAQNGLVAIDSNGAPTTKGRKTVALRFDDGNGNVKYAAPDMSHPPNAGKMGVDAYQIVSLDTAFKDPTFKTSYEAGSTTWRGHIAGWFDKLAGKFLNLIGISRNRYKGATANMDEADFEAKAAGKNLSDNGDIESNKTQVDADENGDPIRNENGDPSNSKNPDATVSESDGNTIKPGDTPDKMRTKLEARARAAAKVTGILQSGVELTCAAGNIMGVISGAIAAYNAMQLMQYISGFLESVNKTMAGDGSASPMAQYMDGLMTPDASGKTGMTGLSPIFGGSAVNKNDPNVEKTNVLGSVNNIFSNAQITVQAFRGCNYAKIVAQGVSTIISFIPGVGQGFKLVDFLVSAGVNSIIGATIASVMGPVTDFAVSIFGRPALTALLGPELGTAALSAAHMYMSRNHRTGGGSLGGYDQVLAYHRETQAVIAEQAEYERATRSPFDATSQYTFLGSIVNQLIPTMSSLSPATLLSAAGSIGGMFSSSLISLFPQAAAAREEANFVNSVNTECPFLKDIGAVGDAFCNPYIISDVETVDIDPADIIDSVSDSLEGDSGENLPIKPGSDLAKYIIACGTRESTFGTADAGIAGNIALLGGRLRAPTGNGILDSIIGGGISALPGGDIPDILAEAEDLVNEDWISGANCVAGGDNWHENAKYQRYIEDQRLAEEMGIIEKSAVTAFWDDFYEKNPLDSSESGIIARYMGSTKEDTELALGTIEYLDYQAGYDPTGLGPILAQRKESAQSLSARFIGNAASNNRYIAKIPNLILSTDIRRRSYIV